MLKKLDVFLERNRQKLENDMRSLEVECGSNSVVKRQMNQTAGFLRKDS